jgi:hypothetical protein
VAINFVTNDDVRAMREIEAFYNTTIEEMPMNVVRGLSYRRPSLHLSNLKAPSAHPLRRVCCRLT